MLSWKGKYNLLSNKLCVMYLYTLLKPWETYVQDDVRITIVEFPIVLFWPFRNNEFLKEKDGDDCRLVL